MCPLDGIDGLVGLDILCEVVPSTINDCNKEEIFDTLLLVLSMLSCKVSNLDDESSDELSLNLIDP
jgi:hypothetical protein